MGDMQIEVRNQSGRDMSYVLLVEPPRISGARQTFSNVFIAAPMVDSGHGSARFRFSPAWFAITGTNPGQQLREHVSVSASAWEAVTLAGGEKQGTTAHMTAGPEGKGAEFVRGSTDLTTTDPGCFTIMADDTFNMDNGENQFIGLGLGDPQDPSSALPVATCEAEPGQRYVFSPRSKFYIGAGTYSPGDIIDIRSLGGRPAEIDFTNREPAMATVEHKMDGTFSTTYI